MALVKCSECGKRISDKAVSCPNCRYPIATNTKLNLQWVPRQITRKASS